MEKFKNDLFFGEMYEDIVIKLLEQSGFSFVSKSNSDDKNERKEYDFIMERNGRKLKFEVKSDIFSYETKNEIFEYKCNEKNSGIIATKSDFWITCYLLENRVTIYRTSDLKKLCCEFIVGSEKDYRICKAGDNLLAKVILVKHEDMKKYLPNRLDLYIELPIFKPKEILKYFLNKKPKYKKIIKKLNELIN